MKHVFILSAETFPGEMLALADFNLLYPVGRFKW